MDALFVPLASLVGASLDQLKVRIVIDFIPHVVLILL